MPSTQDVLNQDRSWINQTGGNLQSEFGDRGSTASNRKKWAQDYLSEVYDPLIAGKGGYTQDQKDAILREQQLNSGKTTQDQLDSNQLTPDEINQIRGNPWGRAAYFNPDNSVAQQDASAGKQRGAVDTMQSGMEAGITPDLQLSGDYTGGVDSTLAGTEGNVRGAITDRLRADPAMLAKMQVSPEEERNIITSAGISTGNRFRSATDTLQRNARAAGADPLGVAAARLRYENTAAGEAGDSETRARVAAAEARREGAAASEGTRMKGEDAYTGYKTGTELALGNARLGAKTNQEKMRLGAAQDVSDRTMGTAQTVGQTRLGAEQGINAQGRNVDQFNTTTGTGIATGIEQDEAGRAAAIAGNRQDTNRNNQATAFNQNFQTTNALSDRSKTIADATRADAQEGRGYLNNADAQANANQNSTGGQQLQTFGTQGQLLQQNTTQQAAENNKPKWWEKLIGAGIGAAAPIAKAFKGG